MTPMLLLDTTGSALVVGLVDGGEVVAEATEEHRRAQAVLGLVDDVLGQAGLRPADLDRVAVGTGPGGFTGTRVGVATARGIASAARLPLAGISTLAAIAQPLAARTGEVVWARADARRGEEFLRPYRWTSGIAGFSMVAADDLHVVPAGGARQVTGDDEVVDGPPTAAGLAAVAQLASFGAAAEVLPVYGREPDAVPGAWAGASGR